VEPVAPERVESASKEFQEDGRVVKQQPKMKKLQVGDEQHPNIVRPNRIIQIHMPSRGVADVPSGRGFD
jgi:hypothetical protein